ncbi:MAG: hypothetical protein WD226_04730 [Planctomycetota bacterium]
MSLTLDASVRRVGRALRELNVPDPDVLLLLGTGRGALADALVRPDAAPLAGAPHPWTEETLSFGRLGTGDGALTVWALDDLGGDPRYPEEPAWRSAFPIWLAAQRGAQLLIHTSAGSLLVDGRPELDPGGFAVVADHLNLSGSTPLIGLGETRLGPLFPDVSELHHRTLRAATMERAEALGLRAGEAIVACTAGPTLETAAERAWFASTGAEVCVQSLAVPVHAAAHAGLRALFLVAVTDAGERPVRVQRIARVAEKAQPALEQLILALKPDLEAAVADLGDGDAA